MRKLLLLLSITSFMQNIYAQKHFISPELTGGIVFHSFTNSTYVSERKQYKQATGRAYTYGVNYTYVAINNLVLKTGMHIGTNSMNIKGDNVYIGYNNRVGNFFWIKGNDSLSLLKTEHALRTLVIPTGIGVSGTYNRRKRSYFYVGVELQHQLLLKSSTNVLVDNTFKQATNSQLQLVEKDYNSLARKYFVSIQPIVEFDTYLSYKLRLKMSANLIKIYLNSWYKELHKKMVEFNFSMLTFRYTL
jgi:hypothetical protein